MQCSATAMQCNGKQCNAIIIIIIIVIVIAFIVVVVVIVIFKVLSWGDEKQKEYLQ